MPGTKATLLTIGIQHKHTPTIPKMNPAVANPHFSLLFSFFAINFPPYDLNDISAHHANKIATIYSR
jgi:hypothetical protein